MALRGIKVIEFMGLAPGPFCGSILADFGANVTVIHKIEPAVIDVMSNGKKMLSVNLKTKDGVGIVKKLCCGSDVVLDTFRPGVMEKLGLDPNSLLKDNPRLIYARLTGYGQTGAFKNKAGHDINYAAVSGVLSLFGQKDYFKPFPPYLADFAGGGVLTALAIVLALFERTQSGKGQIIDASMTEGVAYIGTWLFKTRKTFLWPGPPGTNMLDGGYAFYNIYKTKDEKFMAVGAIEPQFYSQLLQGLKLSDEDFPQSGNPEHTKKEFEKVFASKTQEEWCSIFEHLDACVTPILNVETVDKHICNATRNSFYRNSDNLVVPEPSPRLSRTPGMSAGKNAKEAGGQHTFQILKELGYKNADIDRMIRDGCVYANNISKL